MTPFEKVKCYTPNITEFINFSWYEWVWYHDPVLLDKINRGRWLGPAHNINQGCAFHILKQNGEAVTRSSVVALSIDYNNSEDVQRRKNDFTIELEEKIGNYSRSTINNITNNDPYSFMVDENDDSNIKFMGRDQSGDIIEMLELSDHFKTDPPYHQLTDNMINLTAQLPHQVELKEAKSIRRKRNLDGTLVGTSNPNHILNSRVYEVDFGEYEYHEYSANCKRS